ncbi:hypothetical protein H5410_040987 [Solanum commersonii]|uniref:DUF4283 domain-containing protein n=1 Tax=Solanum commersonii TaxID=4109 RepID=A0A9J5XQI9_SOLCO|nr:hypothetical protein H5410_040987 [Solanum commersonii]
MTSTAQSLGKICHLAQSQAPRAVVPTTSRGPARGPWAMARSWCLGLQISKAPSPAFLRTVVFTTVREVAREDDIQKLQPLTFGSFLPSKFKEIPEETDTSSNEDETIMQDTSIGKDLAKTRLHFSDAGTFAQQPTPAAPGSVRGSQNTGKSLKFIPPAINDCQVTKVWGFFDKPQVLLPEDGYYKFRFQIVEDKEKVLQLGPYFYRNKHVILQNLEIDFDFEEYMIRQIPICVKFPKLPVANAEKISYAGILIELDISQPLPNCIVIETPSGPWMQPVEYE